MQLNICEYRDHPSEKELSDAIESILYHDNKDAHETNVALSIAVESMRCLLRKIREEK
jgi:hypothetical protein